MTDDESLVLAAEDRRRRALVDVDMAALDELFADDIVHIHSTGVVQDKPTLMHHIETRRAFIKIERGPLAVQIYGDTALMTGPMTNTMIRPDTGETIILDGVVTQVLRREAGRWRFRLFQLTLNAPA